MDEIENKLQQAIHLIEREATMRGFIFAPKKTQAIHFCRLRKCHNDPTLFLLGDEIPMKDEVRFLGLIIDRKIRWGAHIDYLLEHSRKVINALRMLTNQKWGAQEGVLVKALCALMRSKMEYGIQIFSSARQTRLKKLEPIFNKGLRMATGLFRTTPTQVLYRVAGIPPLALRRQLITLKYSEKIRAFPEHPLHQEAGEVETQEIYRWMPTRTRPLGIRVEEIVQRSQIKRPELVPFRTPRTPPWIIQPPKIDLSLAKFDKERTTPSIYRSLFQEALQKYCGWQTIYTDGSKSAGGVGCGLVSSNIRRKWRLPKTATVYTTELWGLLYAVRLAQEEPGEKWLICSDSLSALTALKNVFTEDGLVRQLLETLEEAKEKEKKIVLLWVPGHVDIRGNEEADKEARAGAVSQDPVSTPVRLEDQFLALKDMMTQQWEALWRAQDTLFAKIFPSLDPIVWPEEFNRQARVKMTRVATGHTRKTHSYLLLGLARPGCPNCGEPLTVQHLVEECEGLAEERQSHGLIRSLEQLMTSKEGMAQLWAFFQNTSV